MDGLSLWGSNLSDILSSAEPLCHTHFLWEHCLWLHSNQNTTCATFSTEWKLLTFIVDVMLTLEACHHYMYRYIADSSQPVERVWFIWSSSCKWLQPWLTYTVKMASIPLMFCSLTSVTETVCVCVYSNVVDLSGVMQSDSGTAADVTSSGTQDCTTVTAPIYEHCGPATSSTDRPVPRPRSTYGKYHLENIKNINAESKPVTSVNPNNEDDDTDSGDFCH